MAIARRGCVQRVRERISVHTPPSVKVVSAAHGALPADLVLGLGRAAENSIDTVHTHHDEDHAAWREHSHELFDTIVGRPGLLARDALTRGLEAVVRDYAVYRAKGFAEVPGKDMRLVVQGVGPRIESYFDRPWAEGERRGTELVLIGSHLHAEQIAETLRAAAAAG